MAQSGREFQPHTESLFDRLMNFSFKIFDRLDPIETSFFHHAEPRADIFMTKHKRTGEVDVRIVRLDGLPLKHDVIIFTSLQFGNPIGIFNANSFLEVKRELKPLGPIGRDEAAKLLKDFGVW